MIEELLLFASLGVFAGLVAGMFGVGGGIITVPVLVACFISYGFDENIIIHLAIGTSLACIFFTGLSSANAHRKKESHRLFAIQTGCSWNSFRCSFGSSFCNSA